MSNHATGNGSVETVFRKMSSSVGRGLVHLPLVGEIQPQSHSSVTLLMQITFYQKALHYLPFYWNDSLLFCQYSLRCLLNLCYFCFILFNFFDGFLILNAAQFNPFEFKGILCKLLLHVNGSADDIKWSSIHLYLFLYKMDCISLF